MGCEIKNSVSDIGGWIMITRKMLIDAWRKNVHLVGCGADVLETIDRILASFPDDEPDRKDVDQLSRIAHIPSDNVPRTLVEAYCLGKDHKQDWEHDRESGVEEDVPGIPAWENRFDNKFKEQVWRAPFYAAFEVKDFIRNEFKLIAKEIEVLANNTKNRAFDDDVIEVMRTRGVEV